MLGDLKVLNAWIVYQGNPHEDNEFWLIAENGFVIASHLCSHIVWAGSDLWTRRKDRIEALAKCGYSLNIIGNCEIGSKQESQLSEKHNNQSEYKELMEKFNQLLNNDAK